MSLFKYKITEECIDCRVCVELSEKHFEMNKTGKAIVKMQPVTKNDIAVCEEALSLCPVNAIEHIDYYERNNDDCQPSIENIRPIIASDNIKDTLDKYEELKDVLISISPKFKNMQNPVLYNTLAKFASFKDAAKMTGISIYEILHTMNKHIGFETEPYKNDV